MNKKTRNIQWDDYTRDMCFGILGVVLFGIGIVAALRIEVRAMVNTGVATAQFLPLLVCCIGCALSAVLAVQQYLLRAADRRAKAKEIDEDAVEQAPFRWDRVFVCIGLLLAYLLLLDILGIVVCTALYLFVQILYLSKKRDKKTVLFVAALSVVVALAFYLPFRYIFGVMLPLGIFR